MFHHPEATAVAEMMNLAARWSRSLRLTPHFERHCTHKLAAATIHVLTCLDASTDVSWLRELERER